MTLQKNAYNEKVAFKVFTSEHDRVSSKILVAQTVGWVGPP